MGGNRGRDNCGIDILPRGGKILDSHHITYESKASRVRDQGPMGEVEVGGLGGALEAEDEEEEDNQGLRRGPGRR